MNVLRSTRHRDALSWMGEEDDDGHTRYSFAEIVGTVLWGHGLNPATAGGGSPFHLGKLVKSLRCTTCLRWAEAYRSHNLKVPDELVANDATTAPIDEHGLCERCAFEAEDFPQFVAKSGIDKDARNLDNYTPEKMVAAFIWSDRERKRGPVDA